MNYNSDFLDKVYSLGETLTTIEEMAILLDVDEEELRDEISCNDSQLRKSYLKGIISTKVRLRKNELELASAGSPTAVQMALDYVLKVEENMRQ